MTSKRKCSKVSRRRLGLCLGLIGAGCFATYVSAASPVTDTNLPNYVVTATRSLKTQLNVPANTTVITQKDIQQGGYTDVFTAIQQLGNLNSDTYSEDGYDYGSMYSKLKVRALDQGTLLLLNGNPINMTNYAAISAIPIDQIKKIEIVKGAGSTLYGSSAIAGTINIITQTPSATTAPKVTVDLGGGSQRKAGSVQVSAPNVNFGYSAESLRDRYDVEPAGTTGKGKTVSTLHKHGEQTYLSVRTSPTTTISYSHSGKHVNFLLGEYTDGVAKNDHSGQYDTINNNVNVLMNNPKSGVTARAGYNTYTVYSVYDPTWEKKNSHPYTSTVSYAHNLSLDVQKQWAVRHEKDNLIAGASFEQNAMQLEKMPTGGNYDKTTSYALYQSYEYNPNEKVSAIFGLREYLMTPSAFQKRTSRLLPQVQFLYRTTDHSSWYASASRAFVMPRINYGFSYKVNLVNPGLKPQDSWSYELGYKYKDQKQSFTANAFYMDVTNKFAWTKVMQNGDEYSLMANLDKWHNTGLELNYENQVNKEVRAHVGATWQAPIAESKGVRSLDDARFIINTGATYQKDKFTADLNAFMYLNRQHAFYNLEHTSSMKKDHFLKNLLNLRLALTYKPNATDTVSLVGNNLLNRKDFVNIYEYEVMPRSFFLDYKHSF